MDLINFLLFAEGFYYRLLFFVNDNQAQMTESEVERTVMLWVRYSFLF